MIEFIFWMGLASPTLPDQLCPNLQNQAVIVQETRVSTGITEGRYLQAIETAEGSVEVKEGAKAMIKLVYKQFTSLISPEDVGLVVNMWCIEVVAEQPYKAREIEV